MTAVFMCAQARKEEPDVDDHEVYRTGKTRVYPKTARRSQSMPIAHEYTCSCGHVGWTNHHDILRYPEIPA